jgi:hypothetical protein
VVAAAVPAAAAVVVPEIATVIAVIGATATKSKLFVYKKPGEKSPGFFDW